MNVRHETIKLLEEYIGSMPFDMGLSNIFLDMSPQAEKQNKQIGLYQTKKLLNNKGNNQQNEMTTYQIVEHICKSYIW